MGRLGNSDLAIVTIHRAFKEFANDRIVLPSGATSVLSGKCFTHKTNKYMSGNSRHFYGIIKHVACVSLLSHVSYCKNEAAQRTNIKMSPP